MAIGGIRGFLHGGWGFRGLGRPGEWGTATSQKPFRANFRIGDQPDGTVLNQQLNHTGGRERQQSNDPTFPRNWTAVHRRPHQVEDHDH